MAHDVFISHSSRDKPAADAVCAALEAKGIRCWIAPRDVKPSQSWAAAIVDAIRGARIFLLVYSRNANESPQVQREVELAANLSMRVVALRVEDLLPESVLTLGTPHWLDAVTPPFEAHLEMLATECASLLARSESSWPVSTWWRHQRRIARCGLAAAVVLVLIAGAGIVGRVLWFPTRNDSQNATAAPSPNSSAGPAPPTIQAGGGEARAQVVRLTGSWSDEGFAKAVRDRDLGIVTLYLQSGMKATTLFQGASAILYGFQGLAQNGDAVELVKTFQASGFTVDDELEDSSLMVKLSDAGPRSMLPLPFKSPLAPDGYDGGNGGGRFVGSLLFWVVQRSTWVGTDEDAQVMKYLIDQGADCTVPLAFLDYQKMDDLPQYQLMKSCAK